MAYFDDLIVPTVVSDMVMLRVSQQSPYIGSGAASMNFDAQGGNFYAKRLRNEDLTRANVIDGVTSHSPTVLGAERDLSPILRRVRPRLVVDGSTAAEGRLSANPTEDVVAQSASYWAREVDEALGAVLNALLDPSAGCLRTTHRSSIAKDAPAAYVCLSYGAVVMAATLAGDSIADYNAIIVHSRQWADLQSENAQRVGFLPLGGAAPVPFLGSLRVIVSDAVPVSGSGASAKFTAILVRPGALYCSVQSPLKEWVVADAGIPGLRISESLHFAVGAEGTRWLPATSNPDNTGLAVAASWAKTAATPTPASDKRQIGLIALETNASVATA